MRRVDRFLPFMKDNGIPRRDGRRGFILILTVCVFAFALFMPRASGAADDAHIRVLLQGVNPGTRLTVGVYGSYMLDGLFSFQRGSEVTLALQGGGIMAYYEGMAYRAADSVTLTRHETADGLENGLRLQGGLPLYPGDLTVSVNDGRLYAVMTAPVEDYLLGVVPYEMADDFPMEALKAQAVAARTYALRALSPGKPYDVVDGTNDQVYRGTDVSKVNAAKAVSQTQGVVVEFGGTLAQCLYTASNGGLTESALNAWGR